MSDIVAECRAQAAMYLALAAAASSERMRLQYIDRAESWRQLGERMAAASGGAPEKDG